MHTILNRPRPAADHKRRRLLGAALAALVAAALWPAATPVSSAPTAVTPATTAKVTLQADGRYLTALYRGTTMLAETLTSGADLVTLEPSSSDLTGHGLTESLTVQPHGTTNLTNAQIDAYQSAFLYRASGKWPVGMQRATVTANTAATRAVRSVTVVVPRTTRGWSFTPAKILAPARTFTRKAAVPASTSAFGSFGTVPTSSGCTAFTNHSNLGGCYRRNALASDTYYNYSYDQSQASGQGKGDWSLMVAALRNSYNRDHHNAVIQWSPGGDDSGHNCQTVTYSLAYGYAGAAVSTPACASGTDMLREESYYRNEWYGRSDDNTIGVGALDLIKVDKRYNSGFTWTLTEQVCQFFFASVYNCRWEDKF